MAATLEEADPIPSSEEGATWLPSLHQLADGTPPLGSSTPFRISSTQNQQPPTTGSRILTEVASADSTGIFLAQASRIIDMNHTAAVPALVEVDSGPRTPSTLMAQATMPEACIMEAIIFERIF